MRKARYVLKDNRNTDRTGYYFAETREEVIKLFEGFFLGFFLGAIPFHISKKIDVLKKSYDNNESEFIYVSRELCAAMKGLQGLIEKDNPVFLATDIEYLPYGNYYI